MARAAQRVDEIREPGDPAELVRDLCAVEVGAERDMIDPDPGRDVVDVAHDRLQRRRGIVGAVLVQEHHGEVDPDDAAGFADRVELAVGEVSRGGTERIRVRVGRDERRLGELGDVPEAGLVQMREVDEDPEQVAGVDEVAARVGQPGAGVGRGGEAERDALGEGIRSRPDDAERAEAAAVPVVEIGEIGRDRLRALEVDDRVHPPRHDLIRAADDRDVEALERGELPFDIGPGLRERNRSVERERIRRRAADGTR